MRRRALPGYWITGEELTELNNNLVDSIEVVRHFFSSDDNKDV
jgi:hypothetical protein